MTQPSGEIPRGAQRGVRLSERQGVRTLSGIPGDVTLPVCDALPPSPQIHRMPACHGQKAGFIAQASIIRAAAMLNEAERPLLYLGGGVVHSGTVGLVVALAEKAGLPTVMTPMALGALPIDHALSLGLRDARCARLALDECDLLLAVGTCSDDRASGWMAAFCPQAGVVHIGIDPVEPDKAGSAQVGIVGDVGAVLKRLSPEIEARCRKRWLSHVVNLKSASPQRVPGADDPRATPQVAVLPSGQRPPLLPPLSQL